jgi:hypothetical protein
MIMNSFSITSFSSFFRKNPIKKTDYIIGAIGISSMIFMLLSLDINITYFLITILLSFLSLYIIYLISISLFA